MKQFCLLAMVFLFSLSAFADSPIGGFMSGGGCYNGSFIANRVCVTGNPSTSVALPNGGNMSIRAETSAMYTENTGSHVKVTIRLHFTDSSNFFQPDARLPVLVRGIVCASHRGCSYGVTSYAVMAEREAGTRNLDADLEITLNNTFGAEYVETLEKLEVLVPASGQVAVLKY